MSVVSWFALQRLKSMSPDQAADWAASSTNAQVQQLVQDVCATPDDRLQAAIDARAGGDWGNVADWLRQNPAWLSATAQGIRARLNCGGSPAPVYVEPPPVYAPPPVPLEPATSTGIGWVDEFWERVQAAAAGAGGISSGGSSPGGSGGASGGGAPAAGGARTPPARGAAGGAALDQRTKSLLWLGGFAFVALLVLD